MIFSLSARQESNDCQHGMTVFQGVCDDMGIPLPQEKTIGPSSIIIFLGLEIDSINMVIRIPQDKLRETKQKLVYIFQCKKVNLRNLQSLVGLLNFCARAIPSVRAFNRRFFDAMSGISKKDHYIRVSVSMKEDIMVWLNFLDLFNGSCKFGRNIWVSNHQLNLYTDSSGSSHLGCGVYFKGSWAFFPWPIVWQEKEVMRDMTFLELVPILLAIYLYKTSFVDKQIMFYTDNNSLVSVLNKKSSKSKRVMQLIRPLVLQTMLSNMQFKACHIEGRFNCIADAISSKQWDRLRLLEPTADVLPCLIPKEFQKLISSLKLED